MARKVLLLFAALTIAGCATPAKAQSVTQGSTPSDTSDKASPLVPASGTVFVGCGYLVVENHGPTHFSVFVTGKDVGQARKGQSVFVVDGVLIETTTATAQEIGSPSARGVPLLRDYMTWESAYSAKKNGWPSVHPDGEAVPLGTPGIDAFMWSYDFPSPIEVLGQTVVRAAYLTAATDDVVFVASAVARAEDDLHVVWQRLGRVVRALRRSSTPIDIVKLSSDLKASKEPWIGCRTGG
jgi:hypothetical protein